jgi:hypothetical protein
MLKPVKVLNVGKKGRSNMGGIKCALCGKFIGYKEFEDGKTTMIPHKYRNEYEPPDDWPAHISGCHGWPNVLTNINNIGEC